MNILINITLMINGIISKKIDMQPPAFDGVSE
jgi:hypothetical protein